MKKSQLKIMFLMLLLAAAMPLFAQDVLPSGMQKLAESVLAVFTGDFVRIILVICLCGSALAYGFNKDNEKIKRNAIAIGIAAAVIVGAQTIVKTIMDNAK